MLTRVFSTGRARRKRADRGIGRYFSDDWQEQTLPVNVFLIQHPDGLCLVDTGQTAEATKPDFFPQWYPFFRLTRFELEPREEAAAQIVAAGFRLEDVRWVVLTHLHTDHVGGLAPFQRTEVLVARTEWDRAQGLAGRLRGYLPGYWPIGIHPRLIDFGGPAVGPFSGSYDVAGDSRLLVVPLPGHTRGHSALLVRPDSGPSFLCAGDAAITAAELLQTDREVADWCRSEGIIVLTAHDNAAVTLLSQALSTRERL